MLPASRIALLALLVSCCAAMFAQPAQPPLKNPGRIYVASMGENDHADEFRGMLAYELGHVGFKVTDFKQQADTTLTGLLSVRPDRGRSLARVTVFLKDARGNTLWTGDFGATAKPAGMAVTLRQRAEEVARALRERVGPQRSSRSR